MNGFHSIALHDGGVGGVILEASHASGSVVQPVCTQTFQPPTPTPTVEWQNDWLMSPFSWWYDWYLSCGLGAMTMPSHFWKQVCVTQLKLKHELCDEPRRKSWLHSFEAVAILAPLQACYWQVGTSRESWKVLGFVGSESPLAQQSGESLNVTDFQSWLVECWRKDSLLPLGVPCFASWGYWQ